MPWLLARNERDACLSELVVLVECPVLFFGLLKHPIVFLGDLSPLPLDFLEALLLLGGHDCLHRLHARQITLKSTGDTVCLRFALECDRTTLKETPSTASSHLLTQLVCWVYL